MTRAVPVNASKAYVLITAGTQGSQLETYDSATAEAAEGDHCQQRQRECNLRRAAIEEHCASDCREKCNQPCEGRTPEIVGSDDAGGKGDGYNKDRLLPAAIKLDNRGRRCPDSVSRN
jgi:hypothetical protein